ncbi:mechanosensitive ion channel protein MscS [Saccharobesus litoralis]|uniref:Mechanosensitive ion channel protein MscS n=1 Tax=Saccharobesus litoralis TaxID=2172099 RepID=A0A2S0VPV7_9ALTE|nr:mechanosensitive ion channel domain-containing protein [Saccharobesus litoralis]AWB66248.1 mechanosensitive ion channel protein MscS [Saccharobesus litoralis]
MDKNTIFEEIASLFPSWLIDLSIVFILMAGLLFIKRIIFVQLMKLAARKRNDVTQLIIKSTKTPLDLVILCVGLVLGSRLYSNNGYIFSWMPDNGLTIVYKILLVLAVVLFIDRFVYELVRKFAKHSITLRNSRGVIQAISHGIVFGVGLLTLLSTLGISVTPIIASLGITSLAIALALRPTLENLFSGVQLIMDKPIRIGDFVELDSGEQGFVDKIGWRSTWIRMLPNNTVIIPNSVLSQSKVINYFYPEKELSVPVDVSVHYNSDLEFVEKVTLEVAKTVLTDHDWGVTDYETFVVYTSFGDSSVNFTVMLRAKEYFNRFWLKSAFIKALHKRYEQEGIVIPFPISAINLEQEGANKVL